MGGSFDMARAAAPWSRHLQQPQPQPVAVRAVLAPICSAVALPADQWPLAAPAFASSLQRQKPQQQQQQLQPPLPQSFPQLQQHAVFGNLQSTSDGLPHAGIAPNQLVQPPRHRLPLMERHSNPVSDQPSKRQKV